MPHHQSDVLQHLLEKTLKEKESLEKQVSSLEKEVISLKDTNCNLSYELDRARNKMAELEAEAYSRRYQ